MLRHCHETQADIFEISGKIVHDKLLMSRWSTGAAWRIRKDLEDFSLDIVGKGGKMPACQELLPVAEMIKR